jgi:microcystin-dependent protein
LKQIWTTSVGKQNGVDLLNAHAQWHYGVEPVNTYPFQNWADTANNLWKQRNEADDTWIVRGTLNQPYFGLNQEAIFIHDNGLFKNDNGLYGAKITYENASLIGTISPFKALIGNKIHQLSNSSNIIFTTTKAALVYASKQTITGNSVPILGKIDADYPNLVSETTLLRLTFNEVGNPQDTSINNNHIVTMSNCTSVDGRINKARQGNGTSGYMVTGGSTGVTAANPRTERIIFTPHTLSGSTIRYIKTMGNYQLYTEGARLKVKEQSNVYDTGFDLTSDVDYFIGVVYTGTQLVVFLSGGVYKGLIYRTNATFNSTTGVCYFLRNSTAANWNDGTIHYYDLRSEANSLELIGNDANKAILLNHYLSNPKSIMPENSIGLLIIKTNSTEIVEKIDNYSCLLRNEIASLDMPGIGRDFAGAYEPYGYFFKAGQEFSRSLYPLLYNVIGTIYGAGDGTETANLPDERGRVNIGLDNMGGKSANNVTNANADILGASDGEEKHALIEAENGPHDHTYMSPSGNGSANNSGTATPGRGLSNTGSSGSGTPHNNMQPWIGGNKLIKW